MVKNLRSGFTLAEVLTTLMVIGVVAAMTIPTLLNSTTEQQHRVAYRKAMSVLSQGLQLMTAQEVQCQVDDSNKLAKCVQNVISGTLNNSVEDDDDMVLQADADGNVIVTNDGLSFAFYYKPIGGEGEAANIADNEAAQRTIDDICGVGEDPAPVGADGNARFPNGVFGVTADGWSGKDAKCIVIVDVNGGTKGSHGFKNNAGTDLDDSDIDDSWLMGSDQQALILSGTGVRPIYVDGATLANKGFGWVYGNSAQNPVVNDDD